MRRRVAGEVFLVPLRGRLADLQKLFVLNDVGDWSFDRIATGCTLDELTEEVAAEFEVTADQARADLQVFLADLVDAGLAEEMGDETVREAAPEAVAAGARGA